MLRASCAAFCAAVALPVFAATYYVDVENGNDDYDGTTPESAKQTFEAGVASLTAANDELHIAPGHYVLSGVSIDKLSGTCYIGTGARPEDVLIDGDGKCRALVANTSGGHRFVNLTFTNCVATGSTEYGGAVQLCKSAALPATSYLTNVVFACNRAVNGGALGMAQVVLSGCRFVGNVASAAGGGAYTIGNSHSYYIYDCTFSNNTAQTSSGGAVGHNGQYSYGHHYGSTYVGNSAPSAGCFDACAISMVSNCWFIGNSATDNGGVYTSGNITGQFRYFKDCRFIGNTAKNGACIRNTKDGLCLHRCAFNENRASSSVINQDATQLYEIIDCGFTNNVSASGGCALKIGCGRIAGTSFVSNRVENAGTARCCLAGGAVLLDGTYASSVTIGGQTYSCPHVISNCVFEGNGIYLENRADNQSYVRGGAISFGSTESTGTKDYVVTGCTFTGNRISSNGKNNGIDCGGAIWAPLGARVYDSTFADNESNMAGGALAGFFPAVSNCVFTGNYANGPVNSEGKTGCGGAIALVTEPWASHTAEVYQVVADCTFTSNRVNGVVGGALVLAQGHMKLLGCSFTGNEQKLGFEWYANHGGAVAFDAGRCSWWSQQKSSWRYNAGDLAVQKFEIDRCTFGSNASMARGGAINMYTLYVSNSLPSPVGMIRNSLFRDNAVTNYPGSNATLAGLGGALCVNTQPVGLENCTFVGNKATGAANKSLGGAVYGVAANLGITNCVFYGNEDSNSGASTDSVSLPNTAAYGVISYSFGPTASQFPSAADHHNILSDENPFRGDDHCDLALRSSFGAGAGLKLDWMTASSTDLGGKPRLSEGAVDFGCYQLWFKPGFLMLIR